MSWAGNPTLRSITPLHAAGQAKIQIVVLKSYDRASEYLRRVNRWVLALGVATLLLGLVLAVGISRTRDSPAGNAGRRHPRLGQGDFDYELSVDGAAEVRELALAFDQNARGAQANSPGAARV